MRRLKHLGSVTTSEKVAGLAILSCLPHNHRRWTSHSWNNVGSLPLTRGLSECQQQHWWVKLGSLSSSAKIPCYSHIVMMKQLVENFFHTNIFWLIWCKDFLDCQSFTFSCYMSATSPYCLAVSITDSNLKGTLWGTLPALELFLAELGHSHEYFVINHIFVFLSLISRREHQSFLLLSKTDTASLFCHTTIS